MVADSRWWRLLPVVATLLIVTALDPRLLFTATTPSGPDLGAHIFPFSVGVRSLLDSGRLLGWSNGWFAGFPIFYFYFPLPAILAALLTPAVGFGIALKLVTVSGPLLLPSVAYVLARRMAFSRAESGLASFVGSLFLFMESYWHLGGNLYSTLLGEFAFGLSFSLSILFVALITGRLDGGIRDVLSPAVVLAMTAMGHVLTTIAVVIATVPSVLRRETRAWMVGVWALGFALTGFWAVPFLIRSPYMGHLPWIPGRSVLDLLPIELWFVLPAAAAGLVMLVRHGNKAVPFLILIGASVTLFVLPMGLEMRDRLLPYWYFGAHFAAGLALGSWIKKTVTDRSLPALLSAVGTVGLLTLMFLVRGPGSVVEFARENLAGYESRSEWPEYRAFHEAVAALPPGRVLSQGDTVLIRWGSAHAATALPHWAPLHPSLTGFWGESSPNSIFAMHAAAALSPARLEIEFRGSPETPYAPRVGARQAGFLGARYFAAFTEAGADGATQDAELPRLEAGDNYAIFGIDGAPLVSPAVYLPTVYSGTDFEGAALAWFERYARLDEWLVADGPPEWPRRDGSPTDWAATSVLPPSTPVANLVVEEERISFETDAVGVPHLIRVSYFPNWRVEGADGPYVAAPYFMVVVPQEPRVTLEFRDTWVERTGRTLTVLGLFTLTGIAVLRSKTAIRGATSQA